MFFVVFVINLLRFNFDFFLSFVMFVCFNFVLVFNYFFLTILLNINEYSMISVLITLVLWAYKYISFPDHTLFSRVDQMNPVFALVTL
jgi:hypothetical protein